MVVAFCVVAGAHGGSEMTARPDGRELIRQYLKEVTEEDPEARRARHEGVAGRRVGPVLIVRRGASAFAPENSLAACAAAMDYGADGCRVEVRRTRDGVLVVFPDEHLDRLTRGFGAVAEAVYADLQGLGDANRGVDGAGRSLAPPTLAALLDLARERRMLLHLDVIDPAGEEEVMRLLTGADAWDHVVEVDSRATGRLIGDPRLRRLRYKAADLYQNRGDLDPQWVQAALERPGEMILVDDPRVATWVLGRPGYQPRSYTETMKISVRPPLDTDLTRHAVFGALGWVRYLEGTLGERSSAELVLGLARSSVGAMEGSDGRWDIVRRAWIAQTVGMRGDRDATVVRALEEVVQNPTWHADSAYDGLDAACAARALGWMGSAASAPLLIRSLRDHSGGVVGQGQGGTAPAGAVPVEGTARVDRVRLQVFAALGDLPCGAARRFLRAYVRMDERSARVYGPLRYAEATRALLRQRVDWTEVAALLRSPNPIVRGTALIECLDRPTEERTLALRRAMPWADSLPRSRGWRAIHGRLDPAVVSPQSSKSVRLPSPALDEMETAEVDEAALVPVAGVVEADFEGQSSHVRPFDGRARHGLPMPAVRAGAEVEQRALADDLEVPMGIPRQAVALLDPSAVQGGDHVPLVPDWEEVELDEVFAGAGIRDLAHSGHQTAVVIARHASACQAGVVGHFRPGDEITGHELEEEHPARLAAVPDRAFGLKAQGTVADGDPFGGALVGVGEKAVPEGVAHALGEEVSGGGEGV